MHLHEMRDSDNHFVIDPATMAITNKSKKHKLQQGDHNSEIYSFEIPRLLEGHDMTLCNLVQIHYINIKVDKTEQQSDVYKVTDMAVCDPETDTLVFTWTVHGNATQYAGSLNFRIHFYCINDKGEYTYKKHTEIFKGITISDGFDNVAAIEEAHSDILSVFEARLDALEKGIITVPDYSVYFDIDADGLISLNPKYRGVGIEGYQYSYSDNEFGAEGSLYTELPENIVIPDIVNEIAVTSLAPGMFASNSRVKSVTIPEHITEIPEACFRATDGLEEIKGTQNVKKLCASAFQKSRVKKVLLPSLTEFEGGNQFAAAYYLTLVDIGNTVSELPSNCFATCERLSSILGGGNLTSIGKSALRSTMRLKKLPNVDKITNIGERGLYRSRVNHNWKDRTDVTFGTTATFAQYNANYPMQDYAYTPCQDVQLRSTFNQANPKWANADNDADEWYQWADNCVVNAMAHAYSILEQKDIESPIEFINAVKATNSPSLFSDGKLIKPSSSSKNGVELWFNALGGYTVTRYAFASASNVQKLYDALSAGKLVICSTQGGTGSGDIHHSELLYGINDAGEVLVCDSAPHCYTVGDYTALTFATQLYNIVNYKSDCYFAIVEKNT